MERWRQPVRMIAVRDEPNVVDLATGRPTQGVSARLHPKDVDRIRNGYVCINCMEPHETPFPDNCTVCTYPMREMQPDAFGLQYGGVERDLKAQRIREGLDRVDDTHERRFHETKSGIIVPANLGDAA